ncbi:MAG: alpha/beta hydrolase [Inhella sp.]
MSNPLPRTGEQLRLRDGRLLGYQIYGAPQGRPLYFFHGFPGSHEQAALVHEPAAQAGIALVAFDRPGFGDSSPWPAASIDAIADDVAALADHLGHARFAVLGVSCGGPYALAAARRLPQRVQAVGLLAGIGPMHQVALRAGQLPMLRLMFALARRHRWLASPLLALDGLLFRLAPAKALQALSGLLTAPDQALLQRDATLRARFGLSLQRAYAQGVGGALHEVARIARYDGGGLSDVAVPVHIFQSGQDRHVPPAMGQHLAERIPGAQLHLRPDEGHLSIVPHAFAECAALLDAARAPR